MSQAITYFWSIFSNTINLIFNGLYIEQGVTIGWIIVWVAIASYLIRTLLNTRITSHKFKHSKAAHQKEVKKGD